MAIEEVDYDPFAKGAAEKPSSDVEAVDYDPFGPPRGQVEAGNIDTSKRPVVKNDDGSISTVRTISIGTDKGEVVIPTVSDDGRILSDADAIDLYKRTGRHLGTFKTVKDATDFAKSLHDSQAQEYAGVEAVDYDPFASTKPASAEDKARLMDFGGNDMGVESLRQQKRVFEQPPENLPEEESFAGIGEKLLKHYIPGGFKQAGAAALQFIGQNKLGGGPTGFVDEAQMEQLAKLPAAMRASIGEEGTPANIGKTMFMSAKADMEANAPKLNDASLKYFAFNFANSMAQMAPALTLSIATGNAGLGLGVMGAQAFTQKYGESTNVDGRSPEAATMDATVAALAEVIPEKLPLEAILKPGGKFFPKLAKVMGLEAASELITEIVNFGYEKTLIHPDMPWGDAWPRLRDAGVLGAIMGGAMTGVAHPFTREKDPKPHPVDNLPPAAVTVSPPSVPVVPGPEAGGPPELPIGLLDGAKAPVGATPEDIASPLDTGLIVRGKQLAQEGAAALGANEILAANGWPGIGQRVTVDRGAGPVGGTVRDAFSSSVPELGKTGQGIKIDLDDQTSFEGFADEITKAGVRIQPEAGTLAPAEEAPAQAAPVASEGLLEPMGAGTSVPPADRPEPVATDYERAVAFARERPSTSYVQRKMGLPYDQAAAFIARMEREGIVSPMDAKGNRTILTPIQPAATPAPPVKGDGSRSAPVLVEHRDHVDVAADRANRTPTDAQKEAGNYEMGHMRLHGLEITIETPRDADRTGVGADGQAWSVKMPEHYGYIRRTTGADGEQVDAYIGRAPESTTVFVIDQKNDNGAFDEHKVMLGFPAKNAAIAAYNAAFSDGRGPERMGAIHEMSIEDFKAHLETGDYTQPLANQTMRMSQKPAANEAPAGPQGDAPAQEIGNALNREDTRAIATYALESGLQSGTPEWDRARRLVRQEQIIRSSDDMAMLTTARAFLAANPGKAVKFKDETTPAPAPAAAKPAPEPSAGWRVRDLARDDGRYAVATGARLKTVSGRQTAPAPKFNQATPRTVKASLKAQEEWLLAEAIEEAELQNSPGRNALPFLRGMRPGNMSMSDHYTVNDVLFGDMNGPKDQAPAAPRQAPIPRAAAPGGPKVVINYVGKDGLTEAERGAKAVEQPVPQEAVRQAWYQVGDETERELLHEILSRKLAKKGALTAADIPAEISNRIDTASWALLRQALGSDPKGTIALLPVKPASAESPAPIEKADKSIDNDMPKKAYGAENKVFTQEERAAAAARIRNRFKNQSNAGLDPDMLADGIKVAGYHIEAGARTFTQFAKAMIEELGEAVRPYLKSWYNAVRDYPGIDAEGMTPYAEITAEMVAEAGKDESDGLQSTVPDSDERAGPGDAPGSDDRGQAGRAPGAEVEGSSRDVRRPDQERGEAAERGAGERVGKQRGGETGSRDADRLPHRGRADAGVKGQNYIIEPGALQEGRGFRQKARDNVRALELARQIESEGRPATKAEQDQIALYVGWGGIKGAFPDTDGQFSQGFEDVGEKLKKLLTPAEYKTAQRSIQYAHYTAEAIVREMWRAVERLGFAGGQVFEPGMGVGNFAGMMPSNIAAASQYSGLEFDHTTARIARLLYPQSGVRQDDFTKAPLPRDTYDLVIGNPPFGDIPIKTDPAYKQNFLIHDYFFAKSLDAVRPGGLLAFVTSAGTLNKIDTKARDYFAERAEFVGAIRLPGDAFKENAGTQVTTDIIFLRKLLPGEVAKNLDWVKTGEATLPNKEGGTKTGAVSQYFLDNPQMVLGEQGFFDKLLPGRYGVRADGRDFKAALAEAIDTLPAGVMTDRTTPTERAELDFSTGQKKEGSYYFKGDELMQMRAGVGKPVQKRGAGVTGGKTTPEIQRIKALIPIRDALRTVYEADLREDAAAGTKARETLNRAYDGFLQKYGPINKAEFQHRRPTSIQAESARSEAREEARFNGAIFDEGTFDPAPLIQAKAKLADIARARKEAREQAEKLGRPWSEGSFDPADMADVVIDKRPNVDPFMEDPESYRLRSIERYNDDTGEAKKGPVFFGNVIRKEMPPEIKTVGDALLYVLNQKGRVDLEDIASRAKLSISEAIEQLGESVFLKPGTTDVWETRQQYLSGDVRAKLREAQAAADADARFSRNVDALRAVQPAPLPPSEIAANLGMPWIPTDVVRDFALDAMGLDRAKIRYLPPLAQWMVDADGNSAAATATWGTADRPANKLLLDALNRQDPKIYDTVYIDNQKKEVLNPEKTQAAQDKVRAIKDKFAEWVWEDEARTGKLVELYNENYNNLVVPEYDGTYLTTPGIAEGWKWRPHQTRVIARIIQSGNTYMAHAVGAGKTSAMIAAGMELRRLGLVRKPMYAVPNHMLGQFAKEFYEQYPTAKIMVADEKRFHTDTRKQFISDVASEDLDAVIITHSAFGMIPVSAQFQDDIIQEQIDEFRDLLTSIDKGDPDNRITRSRMENAIEKLEQRLGGNAKRQDETFTFEEMGVDFLFVDEAHLFRKLDFATKMSSVKGISPEGSKASWDLYVKTRFLHTIKPGHHLVLASGTPVTNTMAELYTVSRYIQPHELAARQLGHFDAWAAAFGDTKTELEQNAAGGYKPTTRFSKFVNIPELSAMVRQSMDVVTSKQLSGYVTRPTLFGGKRDLIIADKTPRLEAFQQGLARRMVAIEKRKGPPQKGDDIMLTVINDGRHAAIDMRLVDPRLPKDPGSKLEVMIDNVFAEWEATKNQPFHKPRVSNDPANPETGYESAPFMHGPATQMIFANLGINAEFAVHKYIVNELARRGVPRSEIAVISDFKTMVQRQRLFNDMNEGKVRVLIGSTAKMATGVNAQKRLSTINNLDPLWYPSDDEQRNGRGLRQGNMNPLLKIKDYSTKGTYDSTMWGMMERKAKFIQAFFEGDPSIRDMEDLGEASQYEQAKAITTNDPRLITLTEDRQELEKERRRQGGFEREQYSIRERIQYAEREAESGAKAVAAIEKDIAQAEDTSGENFKASLGDETFDERKPFGEALMQRLEELAATGIAQESVKIGKLGGFQLVGHVREIRHEGKKHLAYSLEMQRNGGRGNLIATNTTPLAVVRGVENAIQRMPGELDQQRRRIAMAEQDIADFTPKLGGKFDTSKMKALAEKVQALEAQLASEAAAAQAAMAAAAPAAEEAPAPKASRFANDDNEDGAANTDEIGEIYNTIRSVIGQFFADVERDQNAHYAPGLIKAAEELRDYVDTAGVAGMIRNPGEWKAKLKGYLDANAAFQANMRADNVTPLAARIGADQPLRSLLGDVARRSQAEALEQVKAILLEQFQALGLDDKLALTVHKRLQDSTGEDVKGLYWPGGGLIEIALKGDPRQTLKHEAIHALRDLGLFRPAEWAALERAARGNTQLWNEAKAAYATADLTEDQLVEEVVAEMFARWKPADPAPTMIKRAMEKIAAFFRGLRAALTQAGYTNAEDLMAAISRGEVGRRGEPIEWLDAPGPMGISPELMDAPKAPVSKASKMGPIRDVDPVAFANSQAEERFAAAKKGVGGGDGFLAQASEWMERQVQGFTRHYQALPNIKVFADVHQQLRKLEAAPSAAKSEIVRILEKMVGDLTPAEMDLFTRKVVLDDLAWEVTQDHDLPFGLSAVDVPAELAKVDAALAKRPDLMDRIRQRKLVVMDVADRMVAAGVLKAEQIKNPAYYRHQVLDYARAAVKQGVDGKLQKPRWAKRMGSTKDINANMLEAEFDWLHKAMVDIETAKTIAWIKASDHNIRGDVIVAAKAHNAAILDRLLAEDMRDNGYTLPTGRTTSPLNEQMMEFRRSIAMGLDTVRAAVDNGYLDPIPTEYEAAARALSIDAIDESVFPFMAWIMDNDKEGAMGAAGVFKAVSGRKQFVKELLGARYADTSNIDELLSKGFGQDGYVTWQPDAGKLLYTQKTLPEHVMDGYLKQMARATDAEVAAMMGLTGQAEAKDFLTKFADTIRGAAGDALVVGGEKYQMVIPEELAATLNTLRDVQTEGIFRAVFAVPMRGWKRWTLISPRRILKYNLNNLSGDMDAVIAGNPRILRRLPQAIRELYDVMKGGTPSDRYKEAVARGVFDAGITVQEIPDINELSQFENLFNKADESKLRRWTLTPISKVWRAMQDYTQFRENWMRYAAYLDYADRIAAGETMESIGYGASLPDIVDGVPDPLDKAALLARDLVGDYGAVSAYGQGIRQTVMPFYSWMEINTKRYIRLSANAYRQGIGAGLAKTGAIGAVLGVRTTAYLGLRAFTVYGLIQLWNYLLHDDDQEKLDPSEQTQLRLILGHVDGQVVTLRMQGALSDFLGWFGLSDAVGAISEVNKGRASWTDVLTAMAKAPINKVASGITPFITQPFVLASGKKFWPDVFNPRRVRDGWRELFSTFALENEYDALAGRPSRGYGRSWLNALAYSTDPGEQAYNRVVGMAHDWENKTKGTSGSGGFSSPRSEALYNWRKALRFGDAESAKAYLAETIRLGVKPKDRRRSLEAMHPLGSLSKGETRGTVNERARFIATLSTSEKALLDEATAWYREFFMEGARASTAD